MTEKEDVEKIVDVLTDVERCKCGGKLERPMLSKTYRSQFSVCKACRDFYLDGKKAF